jgi:hypothetical protein
MPCTWCRGTRSRHGAAFAFNRLVEQRKTMILSELADLRVR